MIIDIKPNLSIIPIKKQNVGDLLESQTDRKHDWRTKVTTQTLFPVAHNLDEEFVSHNNYLNYLEKCWANHYSAILNPDILWHTLLSEIALIVAENPESVRDLFTTSSEKQNIVVNADAGNPSLLPLDSVMSQLRKLVPDNFANNFLTDFSTTDDRSRMAKYAAFADIVSPYYNYMMLMCGIPSLKIEGTKEDYVQLRTSWDTISEKMGQHENYCSAVSDILEALIGCFDEPNPGFAADIFKAERCGSGHQTEVSGWYSRLYRKQPSTAYAENFDTHISLVKYRNLQNQTDYQMKQGLFMSRVEDQFLRPQFGHMIYEVRV